jgi:DNA-binding XRE family transcriptional regulator
MNAFEHYCWQLRSAVAESGLTRAELADRLGVTPATVKSWVTGRRSPTVRRLMDLCKVLDLDVSRLFERATDMPVQVTCKVCGLNFRSRVGHRIHVAIKAKSCDVHARLMEPAPAAAQQGTMLVRALETSAV